MSDDLLVLNRDTGELTTESAEFKEYKAGEHAPLTVQCRVHGCYEPVAKLSVESHETSHPALLAFARLLLAAGVDDCAQRNRLWRGFEAEHRRAYRSSSRAMRPLTIYHSIAARVEERVPIHQCLSALASYPLWEPGFPDLDRQIYDHAHPPVPVVLDPHTGRLGSAAQFAQHRPTKERAWSGNYTPVLVAHCRVHGEWDELTVPTWHVYQNSMWRSRESIRYFAQTLVAGVSSSCDEFRARMALVEDAVKHKFDHAFAPSSYDHIHYHGPEWFNIHAQAVAKGLVAAVEDRAHVTGRFLGTLAG